MLRHLLLLLLLSLQTIGWSQQPILNAATVQTAIARGEHFLRNRQQPDGSFRDSLNNLFETWETILVTDALLNHSTPDDTTIRKAFDWLRQHESPENLICHNQKCMATYCLETSSLYLQLLSRQEEKPDLSRQLAFIQRLQATDGHWEVGNPDVTLQTGFPSVTGFVLNLFSSEPFSAETGKKARQFLVETQLADGSWGSTWEYYGCPGYALWQCLPAMRKDPAFNESANRAKQFILDSQTEEGNWSVKAENANHISTELHTAFMLLALSEETDEMSRKAIRNGIRFLINHQQSNGSWDGGLFPIPNERYKKREYLIATALTCKLLARFEYTGLE